METMMMKSLLLTRVDREVASDMSFIRSKKMKKLRDATYFITPTLSKPFIVVNLGHRLRW